ncbi:MAG: hypothetical protein RLZZ459_1113 [Cyanobacteriota bacterium]|jgi:hypothetical protein
MTTTTTAPKAAPAAGWIIPAEQMAWLRDDWIDAYQQGCADTFASSVLWASDDACRLVMADLQHLLAQHGTSPAELQADLTAGQQQGAAVLPLTHAAQALAWLGY